MKKRSFTLIELLTVIAIIGILAAILLPTLGSVTERAKRTKAAADIASLKMAISSYQQTYGYLPMAAETPAMSTLIDILGTTAGNPRGIIFLETHSGGTFTDPWENDYHVRLDANYDGEISVSGTTVKGSAAIWSNGPNETNDNGGDDDVKSWED